MSHPGEAEFTFELLVCRWAELAWPPGDGERPVVVARQLGTRERRWDTVVLEVDPEAFAARRGLSERGLDSDLLHVVRHAPPEWGWYREALPHPGYPWRHVRAAVHRAAGRGLVETRKREGRVQLRRVAPYPEWVRRVVAVENKPDLDASAARALADQLAHDVRTALADEVWVATAATGRRVEPALLEDLPVEVGVLAMDFGGPTAEAATVEWLPTALTPEEPAAEREATRRELAERAYGAGWRSHVETARPDCRSYRLRRFDRALVPYCAAKGRHQTAGECAGSCPEYEPEPPGWRTRGPPIEGGPGKALERLLERRRERHRVRQA